MTMPSQKSQIIKVMSKEVLIFGDDEMGKTARTREIW